jgi:hypothetical protein
MTKNINSNNFNIKVMEKKINVFVLAFPSVDDVIDKVKNAIEDAFEKPKVKKPCFCCDEDEDFTPKHLRVKEPCGGVQPWGVCGTPANEDLRFGYGLEVDEPRYQEFDNDEDFLEAREAFDDFVDAGERCVELGLDKRNNTPITKCNAIRKPIGCPPPMNRELLGESQFPWWEIDMDWNY